MKSSAIKFQLEQLGIKVARSTIIAILQEAGLPTGPERGEQSWDEFIRAHSKTLWACDFAHKRVLTKKGWKDVFFLIFIHIKSRYVYITPATLTPTRAWTSDQIEGFVTAAREAGHRPRILIRDRDGKFGTRFDHALRENKVEPVMLSHRSPNMNAYAERFIQTLPPLPVECLNTFIAFGINHLDYLNAEFSTHYNLERAHSSIGRTPAGPPPPKPIDLHSPNTTFRLKHSITPRTRLGGTLGGADVRAQGRLMNTSTLFFPLNHSDGVFDPDVVPMESFRAVYRPAADLSEEKRRLSRQYKVSTLVILRRMLDAGGLSRGVFKEAFDEELKRLRAELVKRKEKGGGGDYYATTTVRVSERFARAVLAGTWEGRTTFTEAFRLLGCRNVKTLESLGERLGMTEYLRGGAV